jgi:hypothetical protein
VIAVGYWTSARRRARREARPAEDFDLDAMRCRIRQAERAKDFAQINTEIDRYLRGEVSRVITEAERNKQRGVSPDAVHRLGVLADGTVPESYEAQYGGLMQYWTDDRW